ncbi:MAG: alpha/beta hydrolase [Aestuariivirgaceae bacterium]
MTYRAMHDDSLMSAEAGKFLDEAPPLQHRPLCDTDMAQLRAEIRAGFTMGAERAIARHRVEVDRTQIAGTPCLEVRPSNSATERTVLYCYGGGYVTGSPFEDLPVSAALADHLKARVVAVDYRLAPEHPYPAAVEDGFAVFRALATSCSPGSWAIAGESAGGNLALALVQRACSHGLSLPSAVALLSPWCDLSNAGDSITANAGRDPTLHPEFLGDAARAYAGARDRSDPDVSPLHGRFDAAFPPTIITSGTRDLLLSQCVRLARTMRGAGVPVELCIWDGLWHVFEFYDQLPEAHQSLAHVAGCLAQRLNGSAA